MTDTAIAEHEAAVQRVRSLHRRSKAIFTWEDNGYRYEAPGPECDGGPGAHECGCWGSQQVEYVCAECHRLGSRAPGIYDYTWPCPTMKAIDGEHSEGVA